MKKEVTTIIVDTLELDETSEIHEELLSHIEVNGFAVQYEIIEAILNKTGGNYSINEIKKEILQAVYYYDLTITRVTKDVRKRYDLDVSYSMKSVILAEMK